MRAGRTVKPRVVHVSSAHPWTDNRIHYRECATLAKDGYDVTLVAVAADISGPIDDVRVIQIPQRPRLRRFVFSSAQALVVAVKTKARIVHLHDPELAWGIPLLRALGRKVIFDSHEDLPIDMLNKPYIPRAALPVLKALAEIIVWLGGRANRVVAATETIARRYPKQKTGVVRNYPPLRQAEDSVDPSHRESAVLYVGAMSAIRGTRQMMRAAEVSEFPEGWKLILAGKANPEVADELVHPEANVEYLGQLPPDEARHILLRGKVGLVPLQDTPAHRDALPTKMFEYFAAGLPVIASDFPLWRKIVEENECGLLIDPSSPEEIARAVRFYADHPEVWERHSRNARRMAVETLNWEAEGRTLLTMYADLAA